MMYLLYNIVLHLLLLALLPYFLLRLLTEKKRRYGLGEKFGVIKTEKLAGLAGGNVVWIHAVSVGETKAAIPLIKRLKAKQPGVKVLFSTITKTGQGVAEADGKGLIDALIYFPLDLPWIVGRVLRKVRPKAFILIEKEFWPNTMRLLRSASIPIVVVNGSISEKSAARYKSLGFFFKSVFSSVHTFCARTDEDRQRAVSSGVAEKNAVTLGNIKFDLNPAAPDQAKLKSLAEAGAISSDTKVIVAGSTHKGEEEILIESYKALGVKDVRLVIAPRHPERFDTVASILDKSGLNYVRRTSAPRPKSRRRIDVLLLDTIGELMSVYSICDVAIVCGSLVPGIGGHNLLEPAFFNKPVLFGPHLTTYLSMAELLEESEGGVRVESAKEMTEALTKLLSNDMLKTKTGLKAGRVVEENRGALEHSVSIIEELILKNRKSVSPRI
ncbi:MAG: 3-deoxy-D-manno-octulosonic acid transferase [Proteobacteria bacterium]|nr:3-deoxy-D-manno-octulosonic acid transferase [Pseudomonadota bacterium]